MEKILVEVCVDSLEGAIVANESGADRLELNLALELDGLTPSSGLVAEVLDSVSIPVITMCRPRSGDFCYSEKEWQTMLSDSRHLADLGVAGIAFGANLENGQPDMPRIEQIRKLLPSIELVYHKAMDALAQPTVAIWQLVGAGVDRIMTSGGCPSSLDGADQIKKLVEAAAGEIQVLPAGGVTAENAGKIVELTGVDQIHGSFSGGQPSNFVAVGHEIRRAIEAVSGLSGHHSSRPSG